MWRRARRASRSPSRVTTSTVVAPGMNVRTIGAPEVPCRPSTANGSAWRPSTMASIALAERDIPVRAGLSGVRLGAPYLARIFMDRTIGREPAHPGRVQDRFLPPLCAVAPQLVDGALGGTIGVEVGANHEIVAVPERVDETMVAAALARRKNAGVECVEHLAQRARRRDGRGRVDAGGAPRRNFGGGQAEDDDVV